MPDQTPNTPHKPTGSPQETEPNPNGTQQHPAADRPSGRRTCPPFSIRQWTAALEAVARAVRNAQTATREHYTLTPEADDDCRCSNGYDCPHRCWHCKAARADGCETWCHIRPFDDRRDSTRVRPVCGDSVTPGHWCDLPPGHDQRDGRGRIVVRLEITADLDPAHYAGRREALEHASRRIREAVNRLPGATSCGLTGEADYTAPDAGSGL